MSDLRGKDFVARVRLSRPDDVTVAAVGETCERVAPESLSWLLEQGYIVPASTARLAPAARAAKAVSAETEGD